MRCQEVSTTSVAGGSRVLPIADCQMPIGFLSKGNWQSEIGNWQCKKPTRYRQVVLTSSPQPAFLHSSTPLDSVLAI
jgi:hypothetical protein